MTTERYGSQELAARKATTAIERFLTLYEQFPILFLAAGGSAISVLENVDIRWLGPQVTFGFGDERYSEDLAVNTFAGIKISTWYARWIGRGVQPIDSTVA